MKKKDQDPDFDVTVGSFDELLGLYIVHILGEKYKKDGIGLQHGGRLVYFQYTSAPQADRIRKTIIKTLNESFDLTLNCKTSFKSVNVFKAVNVLDVTQNLTSGKYQT